MVGGAWNNGGSHPGLRHVGCTHRTVSNSPAMSAPSQFHLSFRATWEALKDPNDLWYAGLATVELVEAPSRTGKTE